MPGGVVNLTSKRPQFSQQGHIRLTGGTQNTKGAAFDYTDAINDQWAWSYCVSLLRVIPISRHAHWSLMASV